MNPMPRIAWAILSLAFLLLAGCASHKPLPFGDVVTRTEKGQSTEQIVHAIRTSRTSYALRGSAFGRLKDAGMNDQLLDYLQQAFINDVDMLTRYWTQGESVGGGVDFVPQQVNLTSLDAPQQYPTRTSYSGFGPQGMPDWYMPFTPALDSFSVEQITELTRQGKSEQELLEFVRTRRLEEVIGLEGLTSNIRTHPIAGLSGSTLARLHKEGIADAVLDEIQVRFLGQFVEFQRLRYQNLGHAPMNGG